MHGLVQSYLEGHAPTMMISPPDPVSHSTKNAAVSLIAHAVTLVPSLYTDVGHKGRL